MRSLNSFALYAVERGSERTQQRTIPVTDHCRLSLNSESIEVCNAERCR